MLFNSIDFLVFFPIVVVLYFAVPKRFRYIWLLAASYYFYMNWNAKYALLLLLSTMVTYLSGLAVEALRSRPPAHGSGEKREKWCVIFCISCNLLILGVFKYLGFALDNLRLLFRGFHIDLQLPVFDIILPVGISFYIFQALSYTIDVYRGKIRAERNILKYALFVSFFPQLVAGPIERSGNLLKQIQDGTEFQYDNAKNGLLLMVWGLFEKIVIADRAAVIVNEVFTGYADYSGSVIVLAVLLFAFQIYCDFGGYSHIAIGAAQVMGFHLMDNFRQPYFASSIQDFWRRWHISLSTWFRDYLYIPLGGSRRGTVRKYVNLMIVFLVSGLWHGASWHFVLWGGMHGAFQIIGDLTQNMRRNLKDACRIREDCCSYRLFRQFLTFMMVCGAWFFFRVDSLGAAASMMKTMLLQFRLTDLLYGRIFELGLGHVQMLYLACSVFVLLAVDLAHEKGMSLRAALSRQNAVFRWACYLLSVFVLLISAIQDFGASAANFIYFQF